MKIFSSAPSLTNIEITNYFNYGTRFNAVFPQTNLPKIKDGTYVIKIDDKNSKGTHWVSLFIDRNLAVYFSNCIYSSISIKKIKDKSVTDNIFRIRDN